MFVAKETMESYCICFYDVCVAVVIVMSLLVDKVWNLIVSLVNQLIDVFTKVVAMPFPLHLRSS